jgi:RNA polymerase sigma-70 factor (ECF subfamily)
VQNNYEAPSQIATAISQGDKKAETALLERYYQQVLFILKKRVGDPDYARDICQEAFRITIERLRRQPLAEPDKLAGFLQNVAINLCIAETRKSERRQTAFDSDYLELVVDRTPGQSQQLEKERAALAVRQLLAELDNERDRRILYRYYIDEMEKEDICAELELGYRHFDKVISRARARFRELAQSSGREYQLEDYMQGEKGGV